MVSIPINIPMNLLSALDLSVYLFAGLILILYVDRIRLSEEERESRSWLQCCGIWFLAVVVGVLACGCRFMMNKVGKDNALKQLSKSFTETSTSLAPPTLQ